ncbi:hypothetical protein [Sphingomonas colocasiae]|uniref:Tetratricopeptide repeat protein n=1 Tax=Sphingomonas colocasiae TaxID=1848973 RepID=A0ABS7PYL9_9SPHN|nr:hypothetical protein [Sphingomonas colocasiae]MBY8823330.1 hypothetical protein [Sphingomonas colocasiae]MBY8826465.1 hypothetical protein [Sphingomonas colocasiae]
MKLLHAAIAAGCVAAATPAFATPYLSGNYLLPLDKPAEVRKAYSACQAPPREQLAALIEACGKALEVEKDPLKRSILLVLRSQSNVLSKDYRQALSDAQEAARLAPERWESLNQLCWASAVSGTDVPGAKNACAQAVGLSGARTDARHSDAIYSMRTGNWRRAATLLDGLYEQNAKKFSEAAYGSAIAAANLSAEYRKSGSAESLEIAKITDANLEKHISTAYKDGAGLAEAKKYFADLGFKMP